MKLREDDWQYHVVTEDIDIAYSHIMFYLQVITPELCYDYAGDNKPADFSKDYQM